LRRPVDLTTSIGKYGLQPGVTSETSVVPARSAPAKSVV
jgi:hypothetical protein